MRLESVCTDRCLLEVKGLPSGVPRGWDSDDARAAESATSCCNAAIRAQSHSLPAFFTDAFVG
jgi:hypothetical protein